MAIVYFMENILKGEFCLVIVGVILEDRFSFFEENLWDELRSLMVKGLICF